MAPPDSVRVLPIPYNTLPCAKYVLPAKTPTLPSVSAVHPAGATPLPKGIAAEGDSKPAGDSKSAPKNKKGDAEEAPDPLPKPIYRPPLPPQEEHPALPSNGVTASWPRTVLPIKHRAGAPGVQSGTGDAPNAVAKKSSFDKFAEEMAYAAAIANLQMNENTKRPDGKQHGIPSGKNATGPNSPAVQAAVSALMVAAVALSAGAGNFKKKLIAALQKGEPLAYKEMADLGEKGAEELAKKYGYQVTQALHVNGAVGPYSVMRKFTDNLGGRYQAHHILEVQKMKDLKLGNPDFAPSVILSDAEHKIMSKKLNDAMVNVRSTKKLWDKYQEVYADHADWIKAIEPYFQKQLR